MVGSRLKKYNFLTIIMAVFEFIIILCVGLVDLNGSTVQRIGAYIVAALFWICVIFESVFVYKSSQKRRLLEQKGNPNITPKYFNPGIISFFKCKEAIIVDILLFVTTILVVIFTWFKITIYWMMMAIISILFLSFNLHCILNGKNYRYLKAYENYEKEHKHNE